MRVNKPPKGRNRIAEAIATTLTDSSVNTPTSDSRQILIPAAVGLLTLLKEGLFSIVIS